MSEIDSFKISCIRHLKEEAIAREKSMLLHQQREEFFAVATKQQLAEWEAFLDGVSAWLAEDRFNPKTAKEAIEYLDAAFPWAAETPTETVTDATSEASQTARDEERDAIADWIDLGAANLGSDHVPASKTAFYAGMMEQLAENVRAGLYRSHKP